MKGAAGCAGGWGSGAAGCACGSRLPASGCRWVGWGATGCACGSVGGSARGVPAWGEGDERCVTVAVLVGVVGMGVPSRFTC